MTDPGSGASAAGLRSSALLHPVRCFYRAACCSPRRDITPIPEGSVHSEVTLPQHPDEYVMITMTPQTYEATISRPCARGAMNASGSTLWAAHIPGIRQPGPSRKRAGISRMISASVTRPNALAART